MRALTWHGKRDVRVETVPDPIIKDPTDVIIQVTSTGLCGSDLHLYEVLGPFLGEGDILGHEPMGVVKEVGSSVASLREGDRVVVPFNVSCGECFMCEQGLQSRCETTQVRECMTDPLPLLTMFDKQIQVRMGQANVRRWTEDILPLLTDQDPLGVDGFVTHHVPLGEAPAAYEMFQKKQDGAVKVLFTP